MFCQKRNENNLMLLISNLILNELNFLQFLYHMINCFFSTVPELISLFFLTINVCDSLLD